MNGESEAVTADWEVIVLVSVGVGAGIFAYVSQVRALRAARRTRQWVLEHHREAWERLPALPRRFLAPAVGLRILRRQRAVPDPEFEASYRRISEHERAMLQSLALAILCVALVLLGTRFWGWTW